MKDEVTGWGGHLRRGNEGSCRHLSFGHGFVALKNRKSARMEYAHMRDGTVELGKLKSEHTLSTYYVLGTVLDAGMH